MKHQQVNVDYWAMLKAIFMYGGLTVMGWIMMRLFNTVFSLPRRMRAQQNHIQNTLAELQRRFPDINITEEDLKNAEKELEDFIKEGDDKEGTTDPDNTDGKEKVENGTAEDGDSNAAGVTEAEPPLKIEDKKTI